MACARGKANPSANTRVRLFADSAGYCQNPECTRQLFVEVGGGEAIHVAEMAHIFAATDGGPRANIELDDEARGGYENLVLLCANCHTTIDKAPKNFPDDLISKWKRERAGRLAALFGATHLKNRAAVKEAIEPILRSNKAILDGYGPATDGRFDPESEAPLVWSRKVLSVVVPSNKRILAILDKNQDHATEKELVVIERFRQHTDDLAARHLENVFGGARFPAEMELLMTDNG